MIRSITVKKLFACAAVLAIAASSAIQAATTFDDFNVSVGHFNQAPSNSGTSTGTSTNSTWERSTTDVPIEGGGLMKLVLKYNGNLNNFRCRFLSSGASPANNVAFVTTSEVDGKIGYYVKTTATGWVTSINLDGTDNSIASMDGSTSIALIADGQWHLYEWDLDVATNWVAVPGIGGGHGGLQNVSHTIDSIYFRYTGTTFPATVAPTIPDATIFLDFVALNPTGSVADLLVNPCLNTSGVLVSGPISTNSSQVVVSGVLTNATKITVYQDSGSGMVQIGSTTTGITIGNNSVTVSGLIKNAQVAATQTIGGQESCVPSTGLFVGGGANPSVRIALSVRETSTLGPVGATNGSTTNMNIHFLGASTISGGAPVNASIFYPSNGWQTVSFDRGLARIAAPTNITSVINAVSPGTGYAANDSATIQIYSFKAFPDSGVTIYSQVPGTSLAVTSNDVFSINWTWNAVEGADGYRLFRSVNSTNFEMFVDVTTNNLDDQNNAWSFGADVPTVTSVQTKPSVMWNPLPGTSVNNLPGQWGILDAIAFTIDNDTGPYDIYIDGVQNGTTVFQDFEGVAAGASIGFQPPDFSGTTSASLLTSPIYGAVTNNVADTGTNSFRLKFQWSGTNASKWLRLTTSQRGNPMINLNDTTSFRMLLLPVGAVPPPLPGPFKLNYTYTSGNLVLTWTDATAVLQSATALTGSPSDWSDVLGATSAYPVTLSGAAKFYRLKK